MFSVWRKPLAAVSLGVGVVLLAALSLGLAGGQSILLLLGVFFILLGVVSGIKNTNSPTNEQVHWQQLAYQDELTGILNRRGFLAAMETAVDRQYCLAMIDINAFKRINDDYGHAEGDAVLVALANLLTQSIRQTDRVCRWGGDEFLIYLGNADEVAGQGFANRLSKLLTAQENKVDYCISIGVAAGDGSQSIESLIKQADRAMLVQKQGQ